MVAPVKDKDGADGGDGGAGASGRRTKAAAGGRTAKPAAAAGTVGQAGGGDVGAADAGPPAGRVSRTAGVVAPSGPAADNHSNRAGLRPASTRMEQQMSRIKDEKADSGRLQALDRAMGQIEKTFGKGAIMRFDDSNRRVINGISTGAISLDLALGGRGVPRGRIVEVYGPESSGKTTLALSVVATAQREGGVAAFIDAEHALDPSWARRIGVDVDQLLVSQPDTGEQALEICEMLVRSNAVDVIVIDSVAALIPRAEIEGEMGDSHVGLQARLMSQALRKLTGAISKSDCTVIFINQLREKIGVMFGSPETTPGGRALKFYSSVRIDVRRIGAIKDGDANIGNHVRARVVKNKLAPPFRDAEFDIMFTEGISVTGDLLDLAVKDDIIAKSGAWFSYGDMRLGQGRENAKVFLKENPDLYEEIRRKVLVSRGVLEADGSPVKAPAGEPVTAGA
jgi:recombination protein RecA